jgi:thiol-disulfide isomerase/thioredoxin
MQCQRFLCLMLAASLLAGCSQEKKNPPPVVSDPGQATKQPNEAQADGKKAPDGDLMTRAQQALAKRDMGAAVAALEELVAAEPRNRDGLFLLCRLLENKGMTAIQQGNTAAGSESLLKSAKYIKQLRKAYPKLTNQEAGELPAILYNEACVLALTAEGAAAMAALEDAVNSGFTDLDLLNTDHDLDKLRALPAFKTFLKSTTDKLMARAKKHASELIAAQQPFNFNFSLPDLDGKTVALKDFAGKVLIADIWGTWCPPCRKEIPHFVDLLKKYEGKGLRIVGINYENGTPADAPKLIREFADANKMNYPCVIGDAMTRSQVPNFEGYPTTLFLDRTGKVRLSVVGYHSLPDLEAIIQELLEDKTASLH